MKNKNKVESKFGMMFVSKKKGLRIVVESPRFYTGADGTRKYDKGIIAEFENGKYFTKDTRIIEFLKKHNKFIDTIIDGKELEIQRRKLEKAEAISREEILAEMNEDEK